MDESKNSVFASAEYCQQLKAENDELETKHLVECGMIAHYDNDVKQLCLIIQDRISYVTDYGKGILEGKYSDSYEYNKGYCTALVDVLEMIQEMAGVNNDETAVSGK